MSLTDFCAWLELQQSEYCYVNARDDIHVLACCLNEELLFNQTPSGHLFLWGFCSVSFKFWSLGFLPILSSVNINLKQQRRWSLD